MYQQYSMTLRLHSFIHLFSQYLLGAYHMPGTVLEARDVLVPFSVNILGGEKVGRQFRQ